MEDYSVCARAELCAYYLPRQYTEDYYLSLLAMLVIVTVRESYLSLHVSRTEVSTC